MEDKKAEGVKVGTVEKLPPAVAAGASGPLSARAGTPPLLEKDKGKGKPKKAKGKKGDKSKEVTSAAPLGNVFGKALEDVLKYQANGSTVPNVVADTIKWLEQNNGNRSQMSL